ncbi:response regulator [Desulfosudis oleivorans]|uniref:Response regulator receiver protein n=1 Tax=Desulfosudis oleivorans (strain DSM 6200 / JCM 39069 / Hxd3) TaxID=96561 RepID=A8ZYQ0_DESOH|nr:response regulator [Desulfosudis oleivorans]ABW67155.1 response regulator receiver protein [Desulfosudis oleivorans Hxd3]
MTTASVLLVDDEEAFATSNAKLLSNRGYDARTALDGKAALQVLAENNIDVTVLDVRMPGMDGISLLTEIKKRFPLVEVIMLSGQATFETAVEGLKLGASDYLMKPCQISDLVGKIEEALEKRKINEEKQRYEAAREQKGAS